MIPNWCAKFVGLPYKDDGESTENNDGYDCWGLLRAVYAHVYNLPVDDWSVEVTKGCWRLVGKLEKHKTGDLLLFTPDGINHHVGLVVDTGRMLHASKSLGQVLIEPYKSSIWKIQHKRTYRHDLL